MKSKNLMMTMAFLASFTGAADAANTRNVLTWIGGAGATAISGSFRSVASIGQSIAGGAIGSNSHALRGGFIQAPGNQAAITPTPITPNTPNEPPTTIDNPHVYPNPFRPGQGHSIMNIDNVPPGTTISIFTYAGELVRELLADSNGVTTWDGRNRDGKKVASGVYYGFIKQGSTRKNMRLAIER